MARKQARGMMAKNYLGDRIANALKSVGITPERVESWLGFPCGCNERKEKLNNLHRWVERIWTGKANDAPEEMKEHMESIMQQDEKQAKEKRKS